MYKSKEEWSLFYKTEPEAARILAQDPSTPPAVLEEMANSWLYQDVQRLLVQNPSTPLEALNTLARNYPKEFFQNPILPLLFLEDPLKLAIFSAYELLFDDEAPAFFLVSLAAVHDEYSGTLIALHPNTPQGTREMLLHSKVYGVPLAAAQGILAFSEIDWSTFFGCDSTDVCQLIAGHPACPSTLLFELAIHDAKVRALVAAHPNTTESVLEILALDPEPGVRLAVAENTATPEWAIERLQSDAVKEVARAAKSFSKNLAGLRVSRRQLGRYQLSVKHIVEDLRQLLIRSSQYNTNLEEDCWCCHWNRGNELENGDNVLDPRDIASNQMHRKRGSKPDRWSRVKNSWPCAIRRSKVSFHL